MYILNITLNIDDSIHENCLHWLKGALPSLLSGNKANSHFNIVQIMSEAVENGNTYSLQFHFANLEEVPLFEEAYNTAIASGLYSNFQDKVVEFRTVLKKVNWNL